MVKDPQLLRLGALEVRWAAAIHGRPALLDGQFVTASVAPNHDVPRGRAGRKPRSVFAGGNGHLLEDLAPMEGNSVSGTFVAQPHPLVDVLHARHEAAPDRSGSPPSRCHVEGPECTGARSQ
jgi:hypothetical protein